ncbi:hypothetical protein GL218_01513 [Daldinia childiae]|uniref:uncharacterized protein n=1 Tax=Daldinia childiae TaxID=326645 RepID=UPI001444DE61|nr:uncharacterized protein GL218_01513 [Daldinia childiae]KAF3065060.1 hypothetical protein GL218_01513 [Daldinia childiae]
MTAPSVPRIRTRKPKVRSGCATCKSRRIKCDEGRPTCARCQRSRLPCKYENSRTQNGSVPVSNSGDAGSQLAPGIRLHDLEGHEVFYFDLFRNVVVGNLSLNGYKNFWTRTVLRESLRDECVRDCVLGTGALCRAMMDQIHRLKQPGAKSLWMVPTDTLNPINTRYHRDALQFYTTAISKFRRRMLLEGSSIAPRTILIISILFIMFEAMQGNTETIDRLMHSAILALESSLSGSMIFGSRLPPNLDDEGVREADYFLARLSAFNSLLSPLFNNPTDFIKFQEEQMLAKDQSKTWCEFLEGKVNQEKDLAQYWSWKTMLVEAKMFNIYSHYSHDLEECEAIWDSQLPTCREIIVLAESVLQEGSPLTGTMPPLFEDKLQPMLRSLICKCRNYDIRSRALALCQKLSGPWFENKAMVVGMRILVELEEQQRDASGLIPYRSRLRWNISSWNDDRTELRMVLTGVITGDRKELMIRKDENIDDMIANMSKLSV